MHEEEELIFEEAPNVGRKQCLFSFPGCDQELAVCRKGAVCCTDGVGNPVLKGEGVPGWGADRHLRSYFWSWEWLSVAASDCSWIIDFNPYQFFPSSASSKKLLY